MNRNTNEFARAEAEIARAEQANVPQARSLFERSPKSAPKDQSEFNRAIVAALREVLRECQSALAEQQTHIARLAQESAAVLAMAERLHEVQRRTQELEARFDEDVAKNVSQAAKAIRNETRERIDALLNEQRVCLRQLSLQTSEEAVLADRARRATELRVEEIAQRLDKLAQAAAA